jgi:hypothetical protein
LSFIAFSYNITPLASTGEAFYFCVFGHDPVVPSFVDDELLPHVQLFGQCFADKYGQALEIVKFKIMNQFSIW